MASTKFSKPVDGEIASISEQIGTLNNKVDYNNTVTLTAKSTGTIQSGSSARRTNNTISVALVFKYTAENATGWQPLASVPSDCQPNSTIYFSGWDNTGEKAVFCTITSNGMIQVNGVNTNHSYYIFITYIAKYSAS